MNGAGGELGDDELQFQYMQRGWVTGWETWDASAIGFEPQFAVSMGPQISLDLTGYQTFLEGGGLPQVGVLGRTEDAGADDPVFEPWVSRYEGPATDWEQVYDEFVILNEPVPEIVYADVTVIDPEFEPTVTVGETSTGDPMAVEQEEPVAFWDTVGDIFSTTLPGAIDAYGAGQGWWGTPSQASSNVYAGSGPGYQAYIGQPLQQVQQAAVTAQRSVAVQDPGTCPPPGPRYMRYNCQTGVIDKIPRRRRRRLLTSSDLKDLAALKAIVGGGAKMDGAIVQAIRR